MTYSITEIIDIAIGLEEAGYTFYIQCSQKFKDEYINNIFSFLAEEELNHKKTFESFPLPNLNKDGIFTDEYYLYLKSLTNNKIFGDPNNKNDIGIISKPVDAIKKAFHDEKESILFYSELKELFQGDSETLSLLQSIIEEERKHILTLQELIETIKLY